MATRLPIQWVPGLCPGVEGSGRVKLTTHKAMNEWSCNCSPHIRLRGVDRDVTFRGLLFNRLSLLQFKDQDVQNYNFACCSVWV